VHFWKPTYERVQSDSVVFRESPWKGVNFETKPRAEAPIVKPSEPPDNGILREGAEPMEIHFPPELEAKLTHSAAEQGRNPDELVQDAVSRYFEEETRFIEAVKRGEEAFVRGEYLTHEQVGERLQRFLKT
jgi:predicted transcriptional regulator